MFINQKSRMFSCFLPKLSCYYAAAIILSVTLVTSINLSASSPASLSKQQNGSHASESVEDKITITLIEDPLLSKAPETVSAENINLNDIIEQPDSILDFIENAQGVSANGQGGLFQTWSIRGVAKHRVRTLVEGIPLVTERRAGISASFIEPTMLSSIDIVRGPVSTFFGTGALGGAANMYMADPVGTRISSGFQTQGNARYFSLLHQEGSSALGISHRKAANSEAANGQKLNDRFELKNFYWKQQWDAESTHYEFIWLEAQTDNIGKSNLRYPSERVTTYPKDDHRLIRLSANQESGASWALYWHPSDLISENVRVGERINTSINQSDDFGANFRQPLWFSEHSQTTLGLDWFARRSVNATEREQQINDENSQWFSIMKSGELDDIGIFLSSRFQYSDTNWHIGTRYNWHQESVGHSKSITDEASSVFIGLDTTLSSNWILTSNLSSGFRFPTLSERFYTGTTARGEVVSVTELETERSTNFDLGVKWSYKSSQLQLQMFHMKVNNYIERVKLQDGRNSYLNRDQGNISGLEIRYQQRKKEHFWKVDYNRYIGKDENGRWLSDIPADELTVTYRYQIEQWDLGFNWRYRREKSDVGIGESATDDANIIALRLQYMLDQQWTFSGYIDNALNKLYVASNDDLDTWAKGRTVGFSVHWTMLP
ncbi:TonB-dependent receptor domain-containing protein [Pleionea mediterranea]|uniref:Iron complex outermembrane receptor protein n=1 Tax=Pleionea mediterranea TaxID=523701 RepID=A0A316FB46_9GAMM|nr:TonB-dependent receptor [Pleionea mediterranea]PWK43590.1 iron complex outermembrane receptor protein [Pleionea mediterranea]